MVIGARRYEVLYQLSTRSILLAATGGALVVMTGIPVPLAANWLVRVDIPFPHGCMLVTVLPCPAVSGPLGVPAANPASKLIHTEALHYE